nr:hypothetical protein GCM10020092_084470 [Actinoplanes digitatis]
MGNPLRTAQDRRLPRIPEPCALVIFGVTGDLSRKKLIPAVYDLANRGLLPPGFVVLGFARRDWGDGDFESLAYEAAKKGARTPWREEVWARLASQFQFVPGSFDDDTAFDQLANTLDELRERNGIAGNAAFYFSIPPAAFPLVLNQLARTGMADNAKSGGWRRVVVEKPFGNDLKTAMSLNQLVDEVFTPRRRVPHRPLPRQGDGPEHPGPALREQPVRAGVELQVRRLGADHHGRGRRHRHPGRVLRRLRRGPRRAAEPPAPAARAGRHGGTHELRPQ